MVARQPHLKEFKSAFAIESGVKFNLRLNLVLSLKFQFEFQF